MVLNFTCSLNKRKLISSICLSITKKKILLLVDNKICLVRCTYWQGLTYTLGPIVVFHGLLSLNVIFSVLTDIFTCNLIFTCISQVKNEFLPLKLLNICIYLCYMHTTQTLLCMYQTRPSKDNCIIIMYCDW